MTETGPASAAPLSPPPGWEGLLDPGEVILWQARPAPGLSLGRVQPMRHVMGLIFVTFSLFWMSVASSITGQIKEGPVGLFPLFGLIFLAIGMWNAGLFVIWNAFVRRFTTYTLTNRRGFVASNTPLLGRKLKSYPIQPDTPLEFEGDDPGTIWFAERHVMTKNGSHRHRIGFERIPEARKVYALLRQIQRGEA
ncbi:aspartate carbamoyltransferase catalytic subunit [Tropicibacter oceani]|uniref:Aspartate carbamoyltransferase catalytic subunit n=1 Tax=Tropicibacter oceani TaxID=3058420 RepID=A0ABY8QJX4_9RHOB|nr:aspartate carbamoyltransferase catalytic subunit [Tropicibacter oceani]WGW04810.1 aspartate carbamoyltransferase catalytic subunit [Tropicibacter oceani]